MNDVIGTIEGTATFDKVEVEPRDDDSLEVTGHYGESVTVYEVRRGHLFIEGFQTDVSGDVTLLPDDDSGWVWVEATEEDLHITSEERDE